MPLVSLSNGIESRNSWITLALYRRRALTKKTEVSIALRRAIDKAVRRKPPGFAADAGAMHIECSGGVVSRCAGAVRRGTEDNTTRPGASRRANLWLVETVENRGKEIFSAARRKGVQRGKAREVYGLRRAVSCGRNQDWRRTELDLGSSKSLDDYHWPTTLGAEPKRARFMGRG